MFFLCFSYSDSEMEKEKNSLDIKWQDDILKDPLSIKDNVKEEEENSLDIKWQDDNLEDPLSIKDNVKEEERNSLDIKWQDDILKDPLSIKDEGEYIIELCVISLLSLVLFYGLVGLLAGLCEIYNDNI